MGVKVGEKMCYYTNGVFLKKEFEKKEGKKNRGMLGGKHFLKKFEKKEAKRKSSKREESGSNQKKTSSTPQRKKLNSNKKSGSSSSKKSGSKVRHSGGTKSSGGSSQKKNSARLVADPNGQQGVRRITPSATSLNKRIVKASRFSSGEQLLSAFREKISGSTFRLLNEQLYSSTNSYAFQVMKDPKTFHEYHAGYKSQLVQWPINPTSVMLEALLKDKRGRFLANKAKSMPGYIPTSWVIVDMGCGDAKIAQVMSREKKYTVHSFDFCALPEVQDLVTIANMSHTNLASSSADICLFSLALMATDWIAAVQEAHRILKPKRLLKIIEVRSRIPSPNDFAACIEEVGFVCDWYDILGGYFVAYDFIRNGDKVSGTPATYWPQDVLIASAYKKR